MRSSLDPLVYLALQGVTPVPSAVAADERDVVITYVDAVGDPQVYDGPSNLVPWASIEGVTDLVWRDFTTGTPTKYDDGIGLVSPVPEKINAVDMQPATTP